MKKILLYSTVAVVLGLLLTLVPLIALAEIRAENHYGRLCAFLEQMEKPEGTHGLSGSKFSAADLEVFAISFAIALVVYVLFKRRIPHRRYRWIGPYPY